MTLSDSFQDSHLARFVLPKRDNKLGDLNVLVVDALCSKCTATSSTEFVMSFLMSTILGDTLVLTHVG